MSNIANKVEEIADQVIGGSVETPETGAEETETEEASSEAPEETLELKDLDKEEE